MGRLDGFDKEIQKPWPRGWYWGALLPEYTLQTDNPITFKTEDRPTTKPGTRQIQLCLVMANVESGMQTKYVNYSVFYSPESLFDADRVKEVMGARAANKGVRGAWSDKSLQRDNLAFVSIHEIEKALNGGKELEQSDQGGLDLTAIAGAECDAFLSIFRKSPTTTYTEEVPKDILDDYFAQRSEWAKGWFYGVKYLDVAGSHTDKAAKKAPKTATTTA